ncbi:energy transducer TonB [Polaribacter septentrionalilitoris]|uniref:hypothetical protein n=1 Tax=Polaribacter septentrionalilitoris TaxID=2494657 RepID=UPI00135A5369|nr:hypothetical protein [Polaribacter septentrionalilitoris]
MKLQLSFLFILLICFSAYAQDKNDIAQIYFKRAEKSYATKDYHATERYLTKAIEYFGGIESVDVATFGAKFYFENKDFKKSKDFLKTYFKLNKNKKSKVYNDMLLLYTDALDAIENPVKTKTEIKKETKKVSPKIIKDTIKVVKNIVKDTVKEEITVIDVDQNQSEGEQGEDVVDEYDVIEEEKVQDVSFMIIEDVPVFPGCYGSKNELKACFSKSVQRHFATKFNADLPNTLGLSSGRHRVFIGFSINTSGRVVNINTRAPHPKIQEEVIRVMQLLPLMTPGRQRGKPVGVKYSIPFTLIVEGDDKKK